MIRTQVYLPQYQIKFLKDLAHVNETTMSEELRKAIEHVRNIPKKKKSKPSKSSKREKKHLN
ncbi:hypothetical protein HYU91_02520 [Candidatus Collierbacteria bacterium]|nr:hypothetical protein [Candidatus Collierbacteria bacterium]